MNKNTVEKICGQYPPNYEAVDIASDPNFVFKVDPNFLKVNVFDTEGNTIIVNSFLECQHYVMGGWHVTPTLFEETSLLNGLTIVVITAIVCNLLIKKLSRL